jgi:UDP-glucuronate decarboxylase
MRVLITGAAGNIGSSLCKRLSERAIEIVAVDNLSTGSIWKIEGIKGLIFERGDVNDEKFVKALFQRYKVDYVFHFAALVGVKRTQDDPIGVLNDINGIKNILENCVSSGVRRFFFSSSSEVYGEPVEIPLRELSSPLNSRLPYAVVKNIGEKFAESYHFKYGLSYTIFRFFNTYGPNQSQDFVIPRFLKAALDNQPINIYGDGNQTRTFLYIDDNIDVICSCLERNLFVNNIINIGSNIEISILSLANTIISMVNSKSYINHLPALKAGDMRRRCPDSTNMLSILGRDPVTLDDGIALLYKSNELFR